jgi:hypothetical protein
MGRTESEDNVTSARDFAHAATFFVSEALLLMQRLDRDTPPSRAASRALENASEAAEDLERLARGGTDTAAAFRSAAWAFQAAAVAFAETKVRADDGPDPPPTLTSADVRFAAY